MSSDSCPCMSGEPSLPNIVALEYQLGLLEIVGPNSQSLDGSNKHRSRSCTGIMSSLAEPSEQIEWFSSWVLPQQSCRHHPFLCNWISWKFLAYRRMFTVVDLLSLVPNMDRKVFLSRKPTTFILFPHSKKSKLIPSKLSYKPTAHL